MDTTTSTTSTTSTTNAVTTTDQNASPLPTIEQATAEFQAGVTAALRAWSALRTAAQNGWGGLESKEKAEFLRSYIFEAFDYRLPKAKLDIDDLEDHLAIYMEEEFSVVLEDQSERQVAQLILQMYQFCGKGDYTLSRQTVSSAANTVASNQKVSVQCDSDDSDDEMETTSTNTETNQYLFGVPDSVVQKTNIAPKPQKPKPEPIIDDDGFTMVTKKR